MKLLTYYQWSKSNRKALKRGYTKGRNACQLAGASFTEWCHNLYNIYVNWENKQTTTEFTGPTGFD